MHRAPHDPAAVSTAPSFAHASAGDVPEVARAIPPVRVAAVGDLHVTEGSAGRLREGLRAAGQAADLLLLCGDLTDYGTEREAEVLVDELGAVKVPIIAVLGNHDFESDQADRVTTILSCAGVQVLDGGVCEVAGVGIAGVKGFAGGFGRGSLGAWGERATKRFVEEALHEAMKLESALAKLRTPRRIALMHYAPVVGTVLGEPPEIYPFLGSSRLEDPLLRYPVDAVFHGHAHRGMPEGRTLAGTPVYNVARPLLLRTWPGRAPFRLLELPAVGSDAASPPDPVTSANQIAVDPEDGSSVY